MDAADLALIAAYDADLTLARIAFTALGCTVEDGNDPDYDLVITSPDGEEYICSAHNWRVVCDDIAFDLEDT